MKRRPNIGDIVGHVYRGSSVEFACDDCGLKLRADYHDPNDSPITTTANGISIDLSRCYIVADQRHDFCAHARYTVITDSRLEPVRYGPYEAFADAMYRLDQRREEQRATFDMHARAFA